MRPHAELHRPVVVLALLTVVGAALRFPWLTAEGLWYDEVFSVFVGAHDIPGLLRLAIDDQTNPPAFYLLLWFWTRLGSFDDAWLRTLPAIIGSLAPAATALAGRAVGLPWRTAFLGGVVVAASPLLVAMSLEVRAYSLLALLATLSLALTAHLVRRAQPAPARHVAALAVLNLALAAVHVFGLIAVLSNTLAGALGGPWDHPRAMLRRARPLLVAAIPAVLCLAAWLALVSALATDGRFAGNAAWVPAPHLSSVPQFVALVVGSFGSPTVAWAMSVALVIALLQGLASRVPHEGDPAPVDGSRMLATAALLPPLAVVALFIVTARSIWLPRYLVATVPPIALLVAASVWRVRAPWRAGGVAFVAAWALLAGVHDARNQPQKPDWASVVRGLSAGRNTTVCVLEGYVGLPLRHYAVQQGLPVNVMDAAECAPGPTNMWAVYRPEFEAPMRKRLAGARLGPVVTLSGGMTATVARRVTWPGP